MPIGPAMIGSAHPVSSRPKVASFALARRRRGLAACICVVVLLVGCGSEEQGDALASQDETTVEGSSGAAEEPTTTGGGVDHQAGEEADAGSTTETSPPTTAGSGLPPVTTILGPAGGDPDNIYRGTLGGLGPDDLVVEPVVEAPPTVEGVMPLTGLAGSVPDRPAAVVKIGNGPAAAPQTGLNAADIVIEDEVEGGVTRFAAVFHSTPSITGPVRSGRTTDISLISSLGSPLYLYSGANDITEMIVRGQEALSNRSFGSSSGYWRDEARSAPSNVYTDTAPHWASAEGSAPPAQFAYRDPADPMSVGDTVSEFAIDYPASPVRWTWVEDSWVRYQRGERHDLVSGEPVSAANVVVVELERVPTGMVDSAGGVVPESVFVGSGPVAVFTAGKKIEGRWTRPTLTSVATLTDSEGDVIELTPGRTWIQLTEIGTGALQ